MHGTHDATTVIFFQGNVIYLGTSRFNHILFSRDLGENTAVVKSLLSENSLPSPAGDPSTFCKRLSEFEIGVILIKYLFVRKKAHWMCRCYSLLLNWVQFRILRIGVLIRIYTPTVGLGVFMITLHHLLTVWRIYASNTHTSNILGQLPSDIWEVYWYPFDFIHPTWRLCEGQRHYWSYCRRAIGCALCRSQSWLYCLHT